MLADQQAIAQRKGLKMIRNLIFSALGALVLTGCIETTHNFMIRLNDIEGLRINDQIFFDQTPIFRLLIPASMQTSCGYSE